jgi:hypothetical protein
MYVFQARLLAHAHSHSPDYAHAHYLTLFFQYGKDWNEYRSKVDNVVWTCCILHNLLLRHDGLEFLWTPQWQCSWQYEDPDLDHRADFDGPPVELRSTRRMQSRYFGRRSKDGSGDLPNLNPHAQEQEDDFEEGGEVGVIDRTPTETSSEHFELRESLVKQFAIRYDKSLVHWLHYPIKKRK